MSFFPNLLAGNVGERVSISDLAKIVCATPTSDVQPGYSDTLQYIEACASSGLLKIAERRRVQTGGTRLEQVKERTEYDPRRGVWETRYEVEGMSYSPPTFTEILMIDRDDFIEFLEGHGGQHLPGRVGSIGISCWLGRADLTVTETVPVKKADKKIAKQAACSLIAAGWPDHVNVLDHPGTYAWLQEARAGTRGDYREAKLLAVFRGKFGPPSNQSTNETIQYINEVLMNWS